MLWLSGGEKKVKNIITRFDTIHERDGQTNRHRTTAQINESFTIMQVSLKPSTSFEVRPTYIQNGSTFTQDL